MGVREAFVLVGPTASGKSAVGQLLAERWGAAVLSADSMQVYRGMDIGTAKPGVAERGRVPYLGLDLVAPDQSFDLWQYLQQVRAQIAALPVDMPLLVVGGSGLYVRALLEGLDTTHADPAIRAHWEQVYRDQGVVGLQSALRERDPSALAALADPQNPRRLIRALEQVGVAGPGIERPRSWQRGDACHPVAGIWPDRDVLRARIAARVMQMYAAGLLEEMQALQTAYPRLADTACQAIGYCEALEVLAGQRTVTDAQAQTIVRTNRLAKRQGTWFRHQSRVDWLYPDAHYAIEELAAQVEGVWREHGSIQLKFA